MIDLRGGRVSSQGLTLLNGPAGGQEARDSRDSNETNMHMAAESIFFLIVLAAVVMGVVLESRR